MNGLRTRKLGKLGRVFREKDLKRAWETWRLNANAESIKEEGRRKLENHLVKESEGIEAVKKGEIEG